MRDSWTGSYFYFLPKRKYFGRVNVFGLELHAELTLRGKVISFKHEGNASEIQWWTLRRGCRRKFNTTKEKPEVLEIGRAFLGASLSCPFVYQKASCGVCYGFERSCPKRSQKVPIQLIWEQVKTCLKQMIGLGGQLQPLNICQLCCFGQARKRTTQRSLWVNEVDHACPLDVPLADDCAADDPFVCRSYCCKICRLFPNANANCEDFQWEVNGLACETLCSMQSNDKKSVTFYFSV